MPDIPSMWNLKRSDTKQLTKQNQTHRFGERTYGYRREEWGEEIVREFGMDRYTLIYLKWITNKDLVRI